MIGPENEHKNYVKPNKFQDDRNSSVVTIYSIKNICFPSGTEY